MNIDKQLQEVIDEYYNQIDNIKKVNIVRNIGYAVMMGLGLLAFILNSISTIKNVSLLGIFEPYKFSYPVSSTLVVLTSALMLVTSAIEKRFKKKKDKAEIKKMELSRIKREQDEYNLSLNRNRSNNKTIVHEYIPRLDNFISYESEEEMKLTLK